MEIWGRHPPRHYNHRGGLPPASPGGGDEGDAEQEDEEDLGVEEGGDRRPLQAHGGCEAEGGRTGPPRLPSGSFSSPSATTGSRARHPPLKLPPEAPPTPWRATPNRNAANPTEAEGGGAVSARHFSLPASVVEGELRRGACREMEACAPPPAGGGGVCHVAARGMAGVVVRRPGRAVGHVGSVVMGVKGPGGGGGCLMAARLSASSGAGAVRWHFRNSRLGSILEF